MFGTRRQENLTWWRKTLQKPGLKFDKYHKITVKTMNYDSLSSQNILRSSQDLVVMWKGRQTLCCPRADLTHYLTALESTYRGYFLHTQLRFVVDFRHILFLEHTDIGTIWHHWRQIIIEYERIICIWRQCLAFFKIQWFRKRVQISSAYKKWARLPQQATTVHIHFSLSFPITPPTVSPPFFIHVYIDMCVSMCLSCVFDINEINLK